MTNVYIVIVLPSQHCHLHSCPLSYQRRVPVLLYRTILNKSQTANNVSADYDKIVEVFVDLDLYLNRLKILEKHVRTIPELDVALAQVLASVLVLCGICAKYVKMKRLGNYTFSSLLLLKIVSLKCSALNLMLVFPKYFKPPSLQMNLPENDVAQNPYA